MGFSIETCSCGGRRWGTIRGPTSGGGIPAAGAGSANGRSSGRRHREPIPWFATETIGIYPRREDKERRSLAFPPKDIMAGRPGARPRPAMRSRAPRGLAGYGMISRTVGPEGAVVGRHSSAGSVGPGSESSERLPRPEGDHPHASRPARHGRPRHRLGRPAEAADWTDAVFPERSHDFGTVARGSKVRHSFKLVNSTAQEIHIASWKTKCGCTDVRVGATGHPARHPDGDRGGDRHDQLQGLQGLGPDLFLDRPTSRERRPQHDLLHPERRDLEPRPGGFRRRQPVEQAEARAGAHLRGGPCPTGRSPK